MPLTEQVVKVWGPYVHKTQKNKDRRFVVVKFNSGIRTMFYSRWLMIKKLGRWLERTEEVDHIDEDKTNDSENNLQILNRQQNAAKMAARRMLENPASRFHFECPICAKRCSIEIGRLNYRRKHGCSGPFCGKSCAATWANLHREKK